MSLGSLPLRQAGKVTVWQVASVMEAITLPRRIGIDLELKVSILIGTKSLLVLVGVMFPSLRVIIAQNIHDMDMHAY